MQVFLLFVLTIIPRYFYSVNDTITLKGEVLKVEREQVEGSEVYHIVLAFKNADTTLRVILGPAWFVEEVPKDGDSCVISGSIFHAEEGTYLIARKLVNTRTRSVLTFRTESGFPLWGRKSVSKTFISKSEGGQKRRRQR